MTAARPGAGIADHRHGHDHHHGHDHDHEAVGAVVGTTRILATDVTARLQRMATEGCTVGPPPTSRQHRQLIRWMTQVMVAEVLLDAVDLLPPEQLAADRAASRRCLAGPTANIELGSIVWTAVRTARRGIDALTTVTVDVMIGRHDAAAYLDRNPEAIGVTDLETVRVDLEDSTRRQRLVGWIDARRHELVRLSSGFEHPGDPRHADAAHHH